MSKTTVGFAQVFYGREDTLERIKDYMTGDDDKPIVLYGEGGCGKTSLLAKTAGLTSSQWFVGVKPINIIRFLGTTPDSSALTPTLISLCQQVNLNITLVQWADWYVLHTYLLI